MSDYTALVMTPRAQKYIQHAIFKASNEVRSHVYDVAVRKQCLENRPHQGGFTLYLLHLWIVDRTMSFLFFRDVLVCLWP